MSIQPGRESKRPGRGTIAFIRSRVRRLHDFLARRVGFQAMAAGLKAVIKKRDWAIREREKIIHELEDALWRCEDQLSDAKADLSRLARDTSSRASPASGPETLPSLGHSYFQEKPPDFYGAISPVSALERWDRHAATIPNFRGAQAVLPRPYVVETHLVGTPTRLLIATREGRAWYDQFLMTEAPFLQYLGMLSPGDIVFDCGSNQGVNSLVYSAIVGSEGKVYGFDPFPTNVVIARINAELNGRGNIEFFQVGISDTSGDVEVSIREQCIELLDKRAKDSIAIALARLDDYAALKPDFLKIDIEGAEVNALQGAQHILSLRPRIYLEVHPTFIPKFGKKSQQIFDFIRFDTYNFFVNYPGMPSLTPYTGKFELIEHCALFCIPRGKAKGVKRYFRL